MQVSYCSCGDKVSIIDGVSCHDVSREDRIRQRRQNENKFHIMAPFTGALFTPAGSSKVNSQERGVWNPADFHPLSPNTLSSSWNFPSPSPAYISHILLSTVATDADPVQMTEHHLMQWQYDFETNPKDWSCQKHFCRTWPHTNQTKQIEARRSICSLKSRPESRRGCPLVAANRWPLTTKTDRLTHLITVSSRFCDGDLRAHLAEVNSCPRALPATVHKSHSKVDARRGEKPTAQAEH